MKKSIAVIFGGRSAEHDVSIITAHTPIIDALLASQEYTVWPIYIAPDGSWYADQAMTDLAYFKQPDLPALLAKQSKIRLLFDDGLTILWPGLRPRSVKIDVVFPALHGTYGEDGSLMGLLRLADVPFVGCDLAASAVAMDKVLTKQVLAAEGIPIVPYVWFTRSEWERDAATITKRATKLAWPVFVKPVHLGSSIAITKVKTATDLPNAVEVALHYDDKVLIEQSIEHLIEMTLPIMGNDELRLAQIERPLNTSEFFDFDVKYLGESKASGGVNNAYSEIPAKLPAKLTERVTELGRETYRVLGCSGIARIDFLIESEKNQVYVNEVNTLPGSLYHHNWRKSGLSNVELVTKLIELAEERHAQHKRTVQTFSSSILQKIGGPKLQ